MSKSHESLFVEAAGSIPDGFAKAITHDDDLIAVVRSQLYLEAQLNELLQNFLPHPERLSNSRLGWGQRVDLVCALGLNVRYSGPLKKIWRWEDLSSKVLPKRGRPPVSP